MRAKVSEQGVLILKQWLEGINEVDIRRERNLILIEPVTGADPVLSLGAQPVVVDVDDASRHHDRYITHP